VPAPGAVFARPQRFRFVAGPKVTDEYLEFDMIGIDASLANAVRRILIAEVRRVPRG